MQAQKKGLAIYKLLITNHFSQTSFHYPPNYIFLYKILLLKSFIELPVPV